MPPASARRSSLIARPRSSSVRYRLTATLVSSTHGRGGSGCCPVRSNARIAVLADYPCRVGEAIVLGFEAVVVASLAAMFAAKEAVAKELGVPAGLEWNDCEVTDGGGDGRCSSPEERFRTGRRIGN